MNAAIKNTIAYLVSNRVKQDVNNVQKDFTDFIILLVHLVANLAPFIALAATHLIFAYLVNKDTH
jgi:hypothetical protein